MRLFCLLLVCVVFLLQSVRLTEGSYPYSCLSLGKQVLKYKSTEEKRDGMSQQPPPSSQSEGEGDLTLTIPESMLTWRGDRTPGTQMLVFRATCVQRPANKLKKKLYNLVSQKGCRKNVVVEVNRLNLGEIGQSVAKGKQQGSFQGGDETSQEVRRNGLESAGLDHAASSSVVETCVGQQGRGVSQAPEVWGGLGSVGGCKEAGTRGEGVNSMCDAACSTHDKGVVNGGGGKGKSSLTKHGLLQKKSKSKLKKAQADAAVMTEISFGTRNIPDMCNVSHNCSPDHHSAKGNQSNAPSDPTFSPPIAKKGFVHRSTSPKLLFRNGSFNGVLNGYALPEVAAALKARKSSQPHKTKIEETPKSTPVKCGKSPISKGGVGHRCVLKDRSKASAKFKRKMRIPAGSGKRGTRSFLVSVPRVHYDSQPCRTSNSADAASLQAEEGKGRSKRRSQMEMLLDGDKPPGQRLSETGIPVFTAEDISNRSSSNTSNGSNSPWLESSTRKITPVDHFTYPVPTTGFSPTKKAHGSVTPGDVNGLPASSSPSSHVGNNPRKRTSDIMEASSPPLLHPPPVKQPKVSDSSVKLPREKPEGVTKSLQGVIGDEQCSSVSGLLQPAPARQEPKTEAAPPDSTAVFSAELAVYDSRGECLVRDGSYSILLQCCSEDSKGPALSTFEPLTWSSVFGDGKTVREYICKL